MTLRCAWYLLCTDARVVFCTPALDSWLLTAERSVTLSLDDPAFPFCASICVFVFRHSGGLLSAPSEGSLSQTLGGRARTMEDVLPLLEQWLARAQEPAKLKVGKTRKRPLNREPPRLPRIVAFDSHLITFAWCHRVGTLCEWHEVVHHDKIVGRLTSGGNYCRVACDMTIKTQVTTAVGVPCTVFHVWTRGSPKRIFHVCPPQCCVVVYSWWIRQGC